MHCPLSIKESKQASKPIPPKRNDYLLQSTSVQVQGTNVWAGGKFQEGQGVVGRQQAWRILGKRAVMGAGFDWFWLILIYIWMYFDTKTSFWSDSNKNKNHLLRQKALGSLCRTVIPFQSFPSLTEIPSYLTSATLSPLTMQSSRNVNWLQNTFMNKIIFTFALQADLFYRYALKWTLKH